MERCGKINVSNSGSESWTGIGVVAGFGAVVLIMQWPYVWNGEVDWGSELLQRLQKVRANCKTRNQLIIVRFLQAPLYARPSHLRLSVLCRARSESGTPDPWPCGVSSVDPAACAPG